MAFHFDSRSLCQRSPSRLPRRAARYTDSGLTPTVSPLGIVRSSRAAAWCAVSGAGVRWPFCAGGGRPTSGTSGFLAVPSSWRRYVGRFRQPIRCPGAGALSQPLSPGCVQPRVVTQQPCNRGLGVHWQRRRRPAGGASLGGLPSCATGPHRSGAVGEGAHSRREGKEY